MAGGYSLFPAHAERTQTLSRGPVQFAPDDVEQPMSNPQRVTPLASCSFFLPVHRPRPRCMPRGQRRLSPLPVRPERPDEGGVSHRRRTLLGDVKRSRHRTGRLGRIRRRYRCWCRIELPYPLPLRSGLVFSFRKTGPSSRRCRICPSTTPTAVTSPKAALISFPILFPVIRCCPDGCFRRRRCS